MENKLENLNEKKLVGKTKSYNLTSNTGSPVKVRNEPTKRKSFCANEAVTSVDTALGRLKKSKLVPGDIGPSATPLHRPTDLLMNISNGSINNPSLANGSLMSMNFSHYELMRNLSCSTSISEGAYSGTPRNFDPSVKNEHMEKYFRSIDMWHRKHHDGSGPSVHFELPEQ
ncbi:hypothetical protein NE865_12561 [Phthorimaea operculella]|nr:hypothetical protein NE865_12561 [Phthorimaea operculella]